MTMPDQCLMKMKKTSHGLMHMQEIYRLFIYVYQEHYDDARQIPTFWRHKFITTEFKSKCIFPFTYAPFILSPTRTRRKIKVPTYTCQYREQTNSPICINLKNKSIRRQPTKHVQLVSLQFVSCARITFTATIHKHTTN